jgi:hypothetical protein
MADYWTVREKRANQKAAEAAGLVADSMDVRLALMERVHSGEITLEQAQAELKRIKVEARTIDSDTYKQAMKAYFSRAVKAEVEVARLTRERDEARSDFTVLQQAVVGGSGLSAITVAPELRNRAEAADAEVARLTAENETLREALRMEDELAFNVNHIVRVRLTDIGREICRKDHETVYARYPTKPAYVPPKEDENGYSSWQLWSLMEMFGARLGMGFNPPFETEILLDKKNLSTPEPRAVQDSGHRSGG